MKNRTRLLVPAATTALVFAVSGVGYAQTSQTYQDANALNTWNATDANWDAGVAWTNATTNSAIFGGTGESVAVTTVNAGDLTFNSTGYTLTGSTITLGAASNITVTNSADSTAISSILTGAGTSLTKSGAGKLTLSGNNSYTGQTIISNGTLYVNVGGTSVQTAVAPAGNLTGTSSITINNGGILEFGGSSTTNAQSGANSIGTNTKPITVNAGGTLKISSINAMGYWNANQYARITLNGGTFQVNYNQYVNSLTIGTGSTVTGSGIIQLYYAPTTPATAQISATDDGTIACGIGLDYASDTKSFSVDGNKTLIISGRVSNFNGGNAGVGFTKTGLGTLLLSNNTNNYGGSTVVSVGTLKLGAAGALGTGATNNGTSVTAGAVLDLNGQAVGAEALTLNGTGISSGGALINSNATAASLSGAVTLASASSINTTGNITLSGVVGGATSALTKLGNGTLTLSNAANTYGGGTTVNAGTLAIGGSGSLGSGAISFTAVGTGLTVNGTAVTLANNIALPTSGTGNVTLLTPNNSSTVLNGTLSGGGAGVTLFFQGGASGQTSGALTLNGANTGLLGIINVQRGPLLLGNANAAGDTQILLDSNNNANGALQLAGNFTVANNVKINYQSQRIGVGTGISAGISGVVSEDSGNAMEKVGAGTLTLSNTNTYTGGTTVTAGTLVVTGSLSATGAVAVNNAGSTLAGTGTIGGATTVATAAVLAPGVAGVGTLNFSNNVTLQLGSNFAVDVTGASTCDKVVVAAGKTIAVDGTITLTPLGHTFVAGNSYDVVDVGAGGSITGTPTIVPASPGANLEWDVSAFNATGVIAVKATTGYGLWASANAPTGTTADDFDSDGVPNGVEYVLGGTKYGNDLAKLPVASTDGIDMTFTFTRDKASITPDTSLAIQVDTDLVGWPATGGDPEYFPVSDVPVDANPGVTVVDNGTTQTITLTVPMDGAPAKFARLQVNISTTP